MMRKSLVAMLVMLMVSAVTFAKDIKTVVFTTTPQMHCENCENKIKNNLRFEKGVKEITTSVDNQTVTVKYDADKTTPDKIQQGFKKFGYEARQLKDGEKIKRDLNEQCDNM